MLLKVLVFIWPFLKEMLLGGNTVAQAIRTHKGRLFVIGLIFLSVIFNFFTIPKLVQISADYVVLNRKYIEARQEIGRLERMWVGMEEPPEPIINPTLPQGPPNVPPHRLPTSPPVVTSNEDRIRKAKESFDRIRALESKERD